MDGPSGWHPEPYRIKVVEPIRLPSVEEREEALRHAAYNLFRVPSRLIYVDLLTDSGTGAMSQDQWAALMRGDEAYAWAQSFERLLETTRDIFGFEYLLPAHQGRALEHLFFRNILKPGQIVPGNYHFDTTRAHIIDKGGVPVDLVIPEGASPDVIHPFKGNIDLDALDRLLSEKGDQVAVVMMTMTCNSVGGQPVSLENLSATRDLCRKYRVPLYLDAARIAENCYFIRARSPTFKDTPIPEIARRIASLCDGILMSAKKDGLVNIGGLFMTNNEKLYEKMAADCILYEGYITYGGLAGRDLEAMAVGLREALNWEYLRSRVEQVARLGARLHSAGIPIVQPVGGHAVFVDASAMLPHLPWSDFPGHALAVALYREGAVRAVEIGSLMLGRDPVSGENIRSPFEYLRLAIPRRVYTDAHLSYVADCILRIREYADCVPGVEIVREPRLLRHFTADFRLKEPVSAVS
ncbi:MAG: tryptophanase [bacterium JZ-2024 1]